MFYKATDTYSDNDKPSRRVKMTADEKEIWENRYKIDAEILNFKLESERAKITILEDEIRLLKSRKDYEENIELKKKISSLTTEVEQLKFAAKHDIKKIELETDIKKIQASNEILKSENDYLKKLLDTYRAMPDVNNMITNLSQLAIPELDKIKDLASVFSGEKAIKIMDKLNLIDKNVLDALDGVDKILKRMYY